LAFNNLLLSFNIICIIIFWYMLQTATITNGSPSWNVISS